MVLKTKSKFYRTKQGKVLLYIPKELVSDSQFPFKDLKIPVEIRVSPSAKMLTVTEVE